MHLAGVWRLTQEGGGGKEGGCTYIFWLLCAIDGEELSLEEWCDVPDRLQTGSGKGC